MAERDDLPLPIDWEPLRRAAPKVGRNDPCPCGSGKKYKKCCEATDAARLRDPSPFEGMTKAEAIADPARTGDARVFDLMDAAQLEAVDATRLVDAQLSALAVRAAREKLGPVADRALDVLATRGEAGARESALYRADVVHLLVREGQLEQAGALLAKLDAADALHDGATLAVKVAAGTPDAFAHLEAMLTRDLDEPNAFLDAAFALHDAGLRGTALAVLRATPIDVLHPKDVDELRREADDIRAGLQLPEADPVLDPAIVAYDRRHPEAELAGTKRALEEAEQTREQLDALKLALGELQRKRADAESELEAARRRAAESTSLARAEPASAEEATRKKLELLKGELREQQRERAELRERLRVLEVPTAPRAAAAPPAEPAEARDPDEGESVPEARPLRPAAFSDVFYDSVRGLDAKTVLKAQETAIRFASYDAAIWRQAKKMRDLPDVFTLRVGLHHRIILRRSSDGGVEVRELVTREAFDATLRGYRR